MTLTKVSIALTTILMLGLATASAAEAFGRGFGWVVLFGYGG
jgi:hypothetical protein